LVQFLKQKAIEVARFILGYSWGQKLAPVKLVKDCRVFNQPEITLHIFCEALTFQEFGRTYIP
jgi:hypothetical protein